MFKVYKNTQILSNSHLVFQIVSDIERLIFLSFYLVLNCANFSLNLNDFILSKSCSFKF